MNRLVARFAASLSAVGLLVGTVFFAFSLTPSLLPRNYLTQGLVSGLSLAAGYGVGVFGRWLWRYLELPLPGPRGQRRVMVVASVLCAAVAVVFLWRAAEWQNSIRALMALEPVDSADPFRVGAIAVLVFVLVLAVARLFHLTFQTISQRLQRYIPRRVANAAGVVLAVALFWSVINGVLFQLALHASDSVFQRVDAWLDAEVDRPDDPLRTGSPESLLAWEELGLWGRDFIASGPKAEQIGAFLGEEAMDPIRVYVGLNSANSIAERAQLALAELERVGGFDRSILVLITPTGTGWVDPKALDPLEYLHRGDLASVVVQYSYLPSWLTLMAEPDYGVDTARAVFSKLYDHWTELPDDERPRLYLHGLSLGALNSERSADIYDVIADPFSGALWSGPPYRSPTWRAITELRQPDSPAWLPRFRDGSVVRFTNQHDALDLPGAQWGPIRIVYLQYASDPVTFFEPSALYRRPEWMEPPRGRDVSPELRWFPVVTMLQLAVDMAGGDAAPVGFGHAYAPEHYIDAWLEVTEVEGWTEPEIERLKAHFADRDWARW